MCIPASPVSSRTNPRVRAIRALRERKERERTGFFFAEGIHLVAAAVNAGAEIAQIVAAPELLVSGVGWEILETQRRHGVPVLEVSAEAFRSLASKEVSQGIGAVVRQRWNALWELRPGGGAWWVALSGVQYPGNLGTILRTGDAVGCAGALLLGNTTDPYDPAAVRASMGGLFSLQLVRARQDEFARWKKERGVAVVATSPSAPTDYRSLNYPEPLVLLMGCERGGLTAEQLRLCDATVGIPMVGRCDSLNLAVSTGVILYEILRQRQAGRT